MKSTKFSVVERNALGWPDEMVVPAKYFLLFVACDASKISGEQIASFANEALAKGLVYCCIWGPDCERFHDLVDSSHIKRGNSESPTVHDTVITTWHENESLEEAVEFFVLHALPTPGYLSENLFGLALSVSNKDWSTRIRLQIERLGGQVELLTTATRNPHRV